MTPLSFQATPALPAPALDLHSCRRHALDTTVYAVTRGRVERLGDALGERDFGGCRHSCAAPGPSCIHEEVRHLQVIQQEDRGSEGHYDLYVDSRSASGSVLI